MFSTVSSALMPRLLVWGVILTGTGLGLIVASFVGEDTPKLAWWGLAISSGGAALGATYYLLRRRGNGQ